MRPSGWKLAWELRPPVQGEVDYDDYRRLAPAMDEYQQALIDASDRAHELAALEDIEPPKVPLDEQRRLARAMAQVATPAPGPASTSGPQMLPPPSQPLAVARVFAERYELDGVRTLQHWRNGWWRWRGSHWAEVEVGEIRRAGYKFTEHASYVGRDGVSPWAPTRRKIDDLNDALKAINHLSETVGMPEWLAGAAGTAAGRHPAGEYVACDNGLLHVPTRSLLDHDPAYFNRVAVPFDFDAEAEAPEKWRRFLDELWPDDPEAVAALQEFFGYVISGRLDLHKILLLIGPTRSGKGTIARVLEALVGRGNYTGPTLASLATNFGLQDLIGKPLAVVSDARLGDAHANQVVERLLSISGEDVLTVDRKYRDPWTGTLLTRFLIISNELPRFGDASGAIANRFIVLTLRESWLGKEDPTLTRQLLTELPGILVWALDGLERLQAQGRFTEPASSTDAIMALADLVSPASAFIRDRCITGPGYEVACGALYQEWKVWAEDNGHRPGSNPTFGRNLRAVVPGLRTVRPRDGEDRQRHYQGIGLLTAAHDRPDRGPSRTTAAEASPVRDGPRSASLSPRPDAEPSANPGDIDGERQSEPSDQRVAEGGGKQAETAIEDDYPRSAWDPAYPDEWSIQ